MFYEYRTYLMRVGEEGNYIRTLTEWCAEANSRGHDFRLVGPFQTIIGEENEVSYFFAWESLTALEKAWSEIYEDEHLLAKGLPWWEREETDGPLMLKVDSELLQEVGDPAQFSVESGRIYEYRVYTMKTSEKHRMSKDGGFDKFFAAAKPHGFETIGPFKPKFGCENQISYFFVWENLEARETAYKSFASDASIDRKTWYDRERLEGPLRVSCVSKLMRAC